MSIQMALSLLLKLWVWVSSQDLCKPAWERGSWSLGQKSNLQRCDLNFSKGTDIWITGYAAKIDLNPESIDYIWSWHWLCLRHEFHSRFLTSSHLRKQCVLVDDCPSREISVVRALLGRTLRNVQALLHLLKADGKIPSLGCQAFRRSWDCCWDVSIWLDLDFPFILHTTLTAQRILW